MYYFDSVIGYELNYVLKNLGYLVINRNRDRNYSNNGLHLISSLGEKITMSKKCFAIPILLARCLFSTINLILIKIELRLKYMLYSDNNMTNPQFRLLNFQVKNEKGKGKRGRDNKDFIIQMFGMNESGETCSIFVKNYTPFFYVKVADHWGKREKRDFIQHLKLEISKVGIKRKI